MLNFNLCLKCILGILDKSKVKYKKKDIVRCLKSEFSNGEISCFCVLEDKINIQSTPDKCPYKLEHIVSN